jgi:hypothetical protein
MRLTVAVAMEVGWEVEVGCCCWSCEEVSGFSRLAKPVEAELDCM